MSVARLKLVASVMYCMPLAGVPSPAFLLGPSPARMLLGQRPAESMLLLRRSRGVAGGGGHGIAGSRRSVWGGRGGSGKGSKISAIELLAKLEKKLEEDDEMNVKWRDLNHHRKQAIPAKMVGEVRHLTSSPSCHAHAGISTGWQTFSLSSAMKMMFEEEDEAACSLS